MTDTKTGTRTAEQNGVHSTEQISEQPRDEALRDLTPPEGSSDSDNAERAARNKLKKASIGALSEQSQPRASTSSHHPLSESITADSLTTEGQPLPRGRLPRKRSFENSQTDDSSTLENGSADYPQTKSGLHKRMRSRDLSSGEYITGDSKFDNGTAEPLEEESDDEAQQSPGGPGILVDVPPREATPPLPVGFPNKADTQDITSPKKKRSRDQFDPDGDSKDVDSDESDSSQISPKEHLTVTGGQLAPTISRSAIGEPEKKRHREEALASTADESKSDVEAATTKSNTVVPPTSGFANSSTAPPFGNFASPSNNSEAASTVEVKSTSTSAFASSGLLAFASSEKSPFGTFGSSQASASGGFGTGAAPSAFGSASSTTKSGFGNTGATSPFAANQTSGFGSLGGFGSSITTGFAGGGFGGGLKPLGGGLSNFASASGTSGFGGSSSKQKAFGAPQEEDEDGGAGGDSDHDDAEDRPKDKRFVEQDLETGEEDEQTVFSCRAKLYHFEGKEWKERGVGTIKLNIRWAPITSRSTAFPEPDEDLDIEDQGELSSKGLERKARLIMRTDGVHRVVLNTPVFQGMKAGTADGGEPTGKIMQLTGMEGGKGVLYTLKVGKDEVLKELWRRIMEVQESL